MTVATHPGRGEQLRRLPIVRRVRALGDASPWDMLEAVGRMPGPTVAWHDPGADLEVVAAGHAAHLQAWGDDREAAIRRWCQATFEQLVEERADPSHPAGDLPTIFTGFSFSPGTRAAVQRSMNPWRAWPDAEAWVPRIVLVRRGGAAWMVAHRSVAEAQGEAERLLTAAVAARGAAGAGSATPLMAPPRRCDAGRERFEALVAAGLRSGLDKVVVARAARLELAGSAADGVGTARALRERFGDRCTTFYVRRSSGSTLVGATPELLVRVRGRAVSTMALAGTAPRGATPAEDEGLAAALLRCPKERHEHQLVAASIQHALAPVVEALEMPPRPRLRRLANVQHLETPIRGRLLGSDVLDLVARLHPTPAVCGHPRRAAAAWLGRREDLDRGWYAAPIGWLAPNGDGAFHVALRCALLEGSRAWAFVGAGVVDGSDPAREWAETCAKLAAVAGSLRVRAAHRGAA